MGRHKPSKPRRERPEPRQHDHTGFEIPADVIAAEKRPVDHGLLGALMGAAIDGCTTCQDPLITLLTEDAATTARVVEMACVWMQQTLGGLPASLTDDNAPGYASLEFRRLARTGLDGSNDAMWQECQEMTPTQRREAANSALDLIVGAM
jgi:hypothetical protein